MYFINNMVKNIDIQSRCPICKKKRSMRSGKVISSQNGSLIVYNKCVHCLSASLSVISKSKQAGGSLIAVETLTDLTDTEAMELFKKKPLTADDVLSVYQAVEE